MTRVPTAVVAAVSLPLGFAVAELTGVRAAGGAVLLAALAWCLVAWWRLNPGVAALLSLIYLLAFVGAHLLADAIGAWVAIAASALAVGLVAHLLVDRRMRRVATGS